MDGGQRIFVSELIGVTLVGPRPLGLIHLRLDPGVTVLYGVNGAGKTVTLTSVESAFKGLAPRDGGRAFIHLRISDEPIVIDDPRRVLHAALFETYEIGYQEWSSLSPLLEDPLEYSSSGVDIETLSRNLIMIAAEDEDPTLADEVSHQRLFSLEPIGSLAVPEWKVWISGRTDGETPFFSDQLRLVRAEEAQLEHTHAEDPVLGDAPLDVREVPSWVPLPFVECYETVGSAGLLLQPVTETDPDDLNRQTRSLLRQNAGQIVEELRVGGPPIYTNAAYELMNNLDSMGDEFYRLLLLDAPNLHIDIGHPDKWFDGESLAWSAGRGTQEPPVALDKLSSAQMRWAAVAIQMVLSRKALVARQTLVLLDEPERALHVLAARHLREGLARLANRWGVPILVTSHSPEFLNDNRFGLHHVLRDQSGSARVKKLQLPMAASSALEPLGITRADLLQSIRLFVLVEGEHDSAVLREFLGSELEQARALLLPFRGTRNLMHLVDAHLLFGFTDAKLLVVLDQVRTSDLTKRWEEARAKWNAGNESEALRFLDPPRSKRTPGAEVLKEFCYQALLHGAAERVEVFGLSESDIINYFPVTNFVPTASSWKQLLREWRTSRSSSDDVDFKAWLQSAKRARVDADFLRDLVRSSDSVPDEFGRLGSRIVDLSGLG
jgi:hypothetical protein